MAEPVSADWVAERVVGRNRNGDMLGPKGPLPRVGDPIRYVFAALPLVADDDSTVFAALLDQSIVGWQRESAKAMRLVLENGAVLRIIENDTHYEFVNIEVTGIPGPGIYL